MRMRHIVVALFLVSCTGPSSTTPCGADSDCAPGTLCQASVCVSLCQSARDCEPFEDCESGLCTEVIDPECHASADCTSGSECETDPGRCVAGSCRFDPIDNGTACAAGSLGGWCWSGVCVPRGCGDAVVEEFESCDDGNTVAGDGCAADCAAIESGYMCFDGLPCRLACRYDGTCPGRLVTILLALDDLSSSVIRETLIEQAVDWVTPTPDPSVLYVRDDHNMGESVGDLTRVYNVLTSLGAVGVQTTAIDEPSNGLTAADISGFDVVWFANPGYPIDDATTLVTLRAFAMAGGGVVLQGDDMAWTAPNGEPQWGTSYCGSATHPYHGELTGLSCVDNGHAYCNMQTDNVFNSSGGDAYSVTIGDSPHPVTAGLEGIVGSYVNDIDIATVRSVQNATLHVLATATVQSADHSVTGNSCPSASNRDIPVVVAQDLDADWSP